MKPRANRSIRIVGGRSTAVEPIRQFNWTALDRWQRGFELRSDERVVGTLRREWLAGTRASAEVGEDHWIFRRTDLLGQSVSIRSPDHELAVATFDDGVLRLAGGDAFFWTSEGWQDTNGTTVVRTIGDRVRVDQSANRLAELFLLIVFAQYLLVAEPDAPSGV